MGRTKKLNNYTRFCKHCKNWFQTKSRRGQVCQKCKDKYYAKLRGE